MMENGKPRKRRQLSPEEKCEIFLEVTSQEISQADAARKRDPQLDRLPALKRADEHSGAGWAIAISAMNWRVSTAGHRRSRLVGVRSELRGVIAIASPRPASPPRRSCA
jgi:hypothetical protein